MRKTTNQNLKRSLYWVFIPILVLVFTSCRKENVPLPSDFTKLKREQLGDLIKVAITADIANFPAVPKSGTNDSTYWYIQKLYDQATNSIKVDGFSSEKDRWEMDREWQVTILDKHDEKTAFITPGGHLYLSTGLLRSLTKENQLYYILAFEATLMNEKYLFNRLINLYNTTTLNNLLLGIPPTINDPTLSDIAHTIADINFDPEFVEEIDRRAVSLICKTSIFDRSGIISLLDLLDENDTKWLQTRKSYDYRNQLDYILNLPVSEGDECGNFVSNGGYQKYVLDKIQ